MAILTLPRRDPTRIARQHRARELEALRNQIAKEARTYGQIVRETLARLGFVYAPTGRYADDGQKRRRQLIKVQFEYERYNEYAVYLKVLTRRLTLFGSRDELPHKTTVANLARPEVEYELSHAVGRRVEIKANDPSKGVWIVIYRSMSGGLLPRLVRYESILPHYPKDWRKAPVILGVGEHNALREIDMDTYPHILIGGSANSGKSNILNVIVSSIVRFATKEQVQLVLVDPKKVEFTFYQDVPHLAKIEDSKGTLPGIIERAPDAIRALRYANRLIDERTEIIKAARAKKLSDYNSQNPQNALHRLIIVIDELASLWRVGKTKERRIVHQLLQRIGEMGRAMGIHLILCTQTPLKEVVPTRLKANCWVRIAGKLADTTSSQVILGTGDAAWLDDIKGRMVYTIDAARQHFQAPFITDGDIDESVAIGRGRAAGIIRYESLKIIPNDAIILMHIISDCAGRLPVRETAAHFARYAVPSDHTRDLIRKIIDAGECRIADTLYIVKRDAEGHWLALADAPTPEPPPETLTGVSVEIDALPSLDTPSETTIDIDLGVTVTQCAVCGKEFVAKSDKARTCSGRCRQMLYKDRIPDSPIRAYVVGCAYDDVKEKIAALKVDPAAARELTPPLLSAITASGLSVDVVIPVPLHETRLAKRGFNQAELIASEIARALKLPVDARAMTRIKDTGRIKAKRAKSRMDALKGSFWANPDLVRGRRVLLIDDVLTTGATLAECARTLHEAGAAEIYAATVASGRVIGS